MTAFDLRPPAQQLIALVGEVRDDQLAGPTPCVDWTVGDLLAHLHVFAHVFTQNARKAPVRQTQGLVDDWAVAPLDTPRGRPAAELATALTNVGAAVKSYASVDAALEGQCAQATADDQILLFGSFFCVGQALEWLERQAPEE